MTGESVRVRARKIFLTCCVSALSCCAASSVAFGYTLWATPDTFGGSGQFFGPGANTQPQKMFDIVIHNLAFVTTVDFVTPYVNNNKSEPNICAEREMSGEPDGRLSNGLLINENVDTCAFSVAGAKFIPAVVRGGPHGGQQVAVALKDGEVIMTMDFALDMNVGARGVVQIPFFGTTGAVTIPHSLQTQMKGTGVDQAGIHLSGTVLKGRVGDFNHDGWIDGTLVSTGVLPLDSVFYPGQPFAVQMNFETDIPIAGVNSGKIDMLRDRTAGSPVSRSK